MKAPHDLTGVIFGRLKVLSGPIRGKKYVLASGKLGSNQMLWLCICDCGTEKVLARASLVSGIVKSCGCWRKARCSKLGFRHGESASRFHSIWSGMFDRCTNPKNKSYHNYGGRGIKVCDRWQKFENFRDDMSPTYRDGLTIERKNNEKGYEPENCEWASRLAQANNTRVNRFIDTPWGSMTISQAARLAGLNASTLRDRVKRGWPQDRLFSS